MRQRFLWLLVCVSLTACAQAVREGSDKPAAKAPPPAERPELERFFGAAEGTFVLYDATRRLRVRYNPLRAVYRFLPGATFAIPHTLIALETGVASDADFPLPWYEARDRRQPWWPDAWAQDHTLGTALTHSVAWFYQELARRIGAERMQAYIERLDYGNRDIEGEVDRFWLTGRLRISADQQLEFLRRFYFEEFDISKRSIDIVKQLLVLEETPVYRLSGVIEPASAGDALSAHVGWSVGYVERAGSVYLFALNVDREPTGEGASPFDIARAILAHLGLL